MLWGKLPDISWKKTNWGLLRAVGCVFQAVLDPGGVIFAVASGRTVDLKVEASMKTMLDRGSKGGGCPSTEQHRVRRSMIADGRSDIPTEQY